MPSCTYFDTEYIITLIAVIDKQGRVIYNIHTMKKQSSAKWIIIFAVLFIVFSAAFLLLRNTGRAGTVAVIYIDGKLYKQIDLNAVAMPYDFTVESEYGYNVVHVEHGGISVIEADCRDHICMNQGVINDDAVPIVCMPHRLVIEIEGDTVDG